jgi:phosphoglycolate phosphatase-like HAD superfamily hydrolase
MNKIVLWDFDGVLADTLKECYEITRRVVEANAGVLENAVGKPLAPYSFEEFRRDRGFCVNAADFFSAYILRRKTGRVSAEGIKQSHAGLKKILAHLDEKYYEKRKALASELGRKYPESMPPYPGIGGAVRALHAAGAVQAVMTARDRESAVAWLAHYRLARFFPLVVGTEVSRADRDVKKKQVSVLKSGLGEGRYYFVDDMAHNLEVVRAADPQIRLVFAGWGYGKKPPLNAVVAVLPGDVPQIVFSGRRPQSI